LPEFWQKLLILTQLFI